MVLLQNLRFKTAKNVHRCVFLRTFLSGKYRNAVFGLYGLIVKTDMPYLNIVYLFTISQYSVLSLTCLYVCIYVIQIARGPDVN